MRLVELQSELRNQLLDEGKPNSVVRLAEHLFSAPVVTAAIAERVLGVTRPTAQSAINALIERGDLNEVTGRDRGRIYEAPQIFDAVYGPVEVPDADFPRQSGAYVLAYDAARKSVAAALLITGHRVRSRPGSHQAVAQHVNTLATQTGEEALNRFDRLRRNRNQSEYGSKTLGKAEVSEAIEIAGAIRAACAKLL